MPFHLLVGLLSKFSESWSDTVAKVIMLDDILALSAAVKAMFIKLKLLPQQRYPRVVVKMFFLCGTQRDVDTADTRQEPTKTVMIFCLLLGRL